MKTLILLPAFNVQYRIGEVLGHLSEYKEDTLIVNDGSTDGTLDVIMDSGFNYLSSETNCGLSSTVLKGLKYAIKNGYTHIITIDSDGQHDARYIERFIDKLRSSDFVIGHRFLRNENIPEIKLSTNLFASLIVKKLFNCDLLDVACGYRGFKIMDFHLIPQKSYEFVYYQLFESLKRKLTCAFVEIPVDYHIDEFWGTKASEISSFLEKLKEYTSDENASIVNELLLIFKKQQSDSFEIDGVNFFGHYLDSKKSYIIQANTQQLKDKMLEFTAPNSL